MSILVFVLTLCGTPHMVLMVDEGSLYQSHFEDLDSKTVSLVSQIVKSGKANVIELWKGSCA